MLTEGVVGEQNFFFGAVSNHRIGPMKHGCRNKFQRPLADRNFIARLNSLIIQIAVTRRQTLEAVGIRRDNFGVGSKGGNFLERAGMIRFNVAGDDNINLRGVDNGSNSGNQFVLESNLRRVNERDFFVENQIGVVG